MARTIWAVLSALLAVAVATPALAHPGSHDGASLIEIARHFCSDPYHKPHVVAGLSFGVGFAGYGAFRTIQRALDQRAERPRRRA